jgi:hypothetical protein
MSLSRAGESCTSLRVTGPDGHGLPCIKFLARRPPLGADARDRITAKRQPEPRFICLHHPDATENDPALLWQHYIQLVAVEQAFKNLEGDLAIRPIFHQNERRIEPSLACSVTHIFIAFPAYCL